jgi:hypothetical protein
LAQAHVLEMAAKYAIPIHPRRVDPRVVAERLYEQMRPHTFRDGLLEDVRLSYREVTSGERGLLWYDATGEVRSLNASGAAPSYY